ncbi:hypothetical protein F2Q69_00012745 [Brassica cretica]|uniref:Uncharacterized protein n=1 Tax=Brassica cretica TaxID=69181 RepID=A0A8S9QTA8_BRACR|nr:hypothetical protein F2Q69_00012745 [Brassica cretica]
MEDMDFGQILIDETTTISSDKSTAKSIDVAHHTSIDETPPEACKFSLTYNANEGVVLGEPKGQLSNAINSIMNEQGTAIPVKINSISKRDHEIKLPLEDYLNLGRTYSNRCDWSDLGSKELQKRWRADGHGDACSSLPSHFSICALFLTFMGSNVVVNEFSIDLDSFEISILTMVAAGINMGEGDPEIRMGDGSMRRGQALEVNGEKSIGQVEEFPKINITETTCLIVLNHSPCPLKDQAAHVYITIGDGGNIEGLATKYAI